MGKNPATVQSFPHIRGINIGWITGTKIACGDHDGLSFCNSNYVVTTLTPNKAQDEAAPLFPITSLPYCRVQGRGGTFIEEIGAPVYPMGWNFLPIVGPPGKRLLIMGLRSSSLSGGGLWHPAVSEGSSVYDMPSAGGAVNPALPAIRGLSEELGINLPDSAATRAALSMFPPMFTYVAKQSWVIGGLVMLGDFGYSQHDVYRAWEGASDGHESSKLVAVPTAPTSFRALEPCLPWVRELTLAACRAILASEKCAALS